MKNCSKTINDDKNYYNTKIFLGPKTRLSLRSKKMQFISPKIKKPCYSNSMHYPQGLRTANEALFFSKSKTIGLGQTIWADKFWGIFGRFISFGTVSPFSMFSINQPLFLQKTKPLYPNPKHLFGI